MKVAALGLVALVLGALVPTGASGIHESSRWVERNPVTQQRKCAGPFNCDIPNPACTRDSAGCETTKAGESRINRKSQRFDIPGTDDDRWPIAPNTHIYDGFGGQPVREEEVRNPSVHINYGQRKEIDNVLYVWAHAAQVTDETKGPKASGWVPQASITNRAIDRMPNELALDPGHGDIATDYRVTFDKKGKFGTLKIRPNSKAKRERAADYLVRRKRVYLEYSLPGNGGYAIDALPENAPFKRAKHVKAVEIGLYRPRSRKQVKTMTFVYGHVGPRYGWIARDAIREASADAERVDYRPPEGADPGVPPPPSQTSGIVGARQVAVGGNGRMMVISACGAAYSKDDPAAGWTLQTGCGNAQQVDVGGGGRMMLISGCGAAFSKDNTFDHFTEQTGCGNARQVAVGDTGRMMLISGCGAAFSKDNTFDHFTEQTGCGNAQQVAVGGRGRMMLISGCGAAFSKDNTFDHFTEQTGCGNARQVAVGGNGRMMLISGCGAAFSKDNTFDHFTEQTGCGNARQVAVGGNGRMMLISGCGAAFSKDNTFDHFTEQTGCGNARQVAVGETGRMMLISGCGAAFSKDSTHDNWHQQTLCE